VIGCEVGGRGRRCDRDTVRGVMVSTRGKGQKLSIQPAQIIMIITIRWRLGVLGLQCGGEGEVRQRGYDIGGGSGVSRG